MDYDIVDDTRPRLQLQSGPASVDTEERHLDKVHVGICVSVGIVLLGCAWTLIAPWQFVTMWIGLSLIIGPFAPLSITGGDCRVGEGEPMSPVVEVQESPEQTGSRGNFKHTSRKAEVPRDVKVPKELEEVRNGRESVSTGNAQRNGNYSAEPDKGSSDAEDREWTFEELELLKKQMVKHPRGTLKRWEVIAEALGDKRSVENVVKIAKTLGERRTGDDDSYSRFLAQRKGADVAIDSSPSQRWESDSVDQGADGGNDSGENESDGSRKSSWSEGEDKSLLTALKTFPKDSLMRWEKVALAIPGRSKAQCIRRFTELRKNFRNSNAKADSVSGTGTGKLE